MVGLRGQHYKQLLWGYIVFEYYAVSFFFFGGAIPVFPEDNTEGIAEFEISAIVQNDVVFKDGLAGVLHCNSEPSVVPDGVVTDS